MGLEQKINNQLNKCPTVKKVIKRIYQRFMYTISHKFKSEGNIIRISPDDEKHEYFFGYYDKSPWDITDRYMLCMKANDTWSDVSPMDEAQILLIDTKANNKIKVLAKTNAWNVQQSCMLQWLGPDYSNRIIYNDYKDGMYCSVILDISTGEEKIIPMAVYSVSPDGSFALTLDFSRLYNLRPGYGYYNKKEDTAGIGLPDTTAIWHVDLESGKVKSLLKYTDFASFKPRSEMMKEGSIHKVNHIMISPNGKRFMVLYRWFTGKRKYSRLVTCNIDGTDMYILSDDDMVSHCFWKNNSYILAFENKKENGPGYYLMKDKTQEYIHCWPHLCDDGHPSYSPDGSLIVTDSYPNRARISNIYLMDGDEKNKKNETIARVFSPFKYDNNTRCDLHPRWSNNGDKICFDSVFEGHRGLYVVELNKEKRQTLLKEVTSDNEVNGLVSCIIPTYKRSNTISRAIDSALSQSYSNIEILVVDDNNPNDEFSLEVQKRLKKYNGDSRVRYIQQKSHNNGAVARNLGIKAARGQYIAFLDDDDEWLATKVQKQIEVFQNDSEVEGVTCLWVMCNKGNEFRKAQAYICDDIQFKILMREVAVFTSTVILKRSTVLAFGGFDETLLRHQDLQFLVDATEICKFSVVSEYLVKLHIDSEINRPNVEKLIKAKEAFFEAEKSIILKYSSVERNRIKNAHFYEVVFFSLKSKKIPIAIKYICKAGISISSFKDLYKRMKERL